MLDSPIKLSFIVLIKDNNIYVSNYT